MKRSHRWAMALAASVFMIPAGGYAEWKIQTIDYTSPNWPITQMGSLNDKGVVAGLAANSDFSVLLGLTYDSRNGQFTVIPSIPNALSAGTWAISDRGVIAGFTTFDYVTEVGFVLENNSYEFLVNPSAVSVTEPRGINNDGMVAGWSDTANGDMAGWIYDPKSKTFTEFLPSGFTIAQGINSRGDVVGNVSLGAGIAYPGSPAGDYAFLRNREGEVTYFQVNGLNTYGRGITDFGLTTGYACDSVTCYGFVAQLARLPFQAITIPSADLISVVQGFATTPEGVVILDGWSAGVGFGCGLDDLAISGNYLDAQGNLHGFVAFYEPASE